MALLLLAALLLCGCSTPRPLPGPDARRFDFSRDTFAFANELKWAYGFDTNGNWQMTSRGDEPGYTLHCYVLARTARQFFDNAIFDPAQPPADEPVYRTLVRRVVASNPRRPEGSRIVIPGFADLRSFSRAYEALLKAECGGAWQCYFQRGNWRMIFPFSRSGQEEIAKRLLREIRERGPVIVHLVRFPQLSINHALVFFDTREDEKEIRFTGYDPNQPASPSVIAYDRAARTFLAPLSDYFPGGRVDLYEIYSGWNY